MEMKTLYTKDDCIKAGDDLSIKGMVVVLDKDILPHEYSNQLFYCVNGDGANAKPAGHTIFMVSLMDGAYCRWNRSDVLGFLKPELLPDSAKLQLSQIRPEGALDLKNHEAHYSGYSFLPDGRYAAGVWLCNEKEVMDYVEMQKSYQYRIMICDRKDFCVLEMQNQELLHPLGGISNYQLNEEMKMI